MNPLGLFGPGERIRAMMPATKPTTMIQIMPLMARPSLKIQRVTLPASQPARQLVLIRQSSVRRQMVDRVRQILAQSPQQFVARQSALGGEMLDLVGAERVG